MSYLDLPRLTFSGAFQADVNTVNNDVRNYSVPTFEARFQTAQQPSPDGKGTIYNGWWNPYGSNAFRLLECVVTGLVGPDELHEEYIIPSMFDRRVAETVALAVREAAWATGVARKPRPGEA